MQKLLTFVVPSCADLAVLSVSTDKTKECLFWRGALDSELGLEQALPELVLHHDASSKIDLLPAPRALAAPPPRTYRLASLAPLPQRLAEALLATRHQGVPNHVPVSGCAPDAPSPWPHDLHDALVLPLLGPNDIVLGALALVHRRALRVPAYADHDLALLEELANRAAIAFDNALLYRNLQREMHRARAAEEKLQEANRRKDEFLAMLSHELRNPLAPIRNATEVMRRIAPADARIGWAREIVERQVKHMAHLVDDLLDVSRITQGKIALRKEPVELGRVIHDSVEAMRELFDARRQHLVLEVPSAPIWVFGDFARLAQVIGNLLNNAAKYTAEGGTIELSADAHHGEAVITVKDNGIGIERDLLPHVFELFMQGERALDRSQGGLGVGLTVVQRLVELHQGRVEAASAGAGTGATFTIVLPCISEVGPAAREGARGGDAGLEARGRRVLVVDDNVDAAETIGVFLRLEGHEVKTVTDGLQALACAQVFAPHVAVVDIGLPGLDGYEVARQLRQQEATAHALLIALTGYGQKEDRDRSDAAGFDHHFVKPADPKTIQDAIDAWIHAGESGRAHPEWAHSS
jgi:signal transduction histidine kinase/ActR/RegA family two-component response regulator